VRRAAAVTLSLLISTGAFAETSLPLCVLDPAALPATWQPAGEVQAGLSHDAWSAEEAAYAEFSIETGIEEMTELYAERPGAITSNWEDAVAALIEITYSGANKPKIDVAARDGARVNLSALIAPYLDRDPAEAGCREFPLALPLALYANKFYQPKDARIGVMVDFTNAAYRACGSFSEATELDYPAVFDNQAALTDDVFDLVIWSLLFIEAELVPGLELPAESREFAPKLWSYLESYPLPNAGTFEDGAWNAEFVEIAYLATHIAYIPTGNHRHPIYIEDAPKLYSFHRENFYAVLEMGELDLVAEFVDTLRQYGCTPENDLQVRDGTRYLLDIFHDGGDRWMAYREPGETDDDVDAYDLVHKAWTGVLGVRPRVFEAADPGTYGGVVRRWLPAPR
jgi:hypothetical protein